MNRLFSIDTAFLHFAKKYSPRIARWAIAIIFIWFGTLKVFHLSPATELVHMLFDTTIPWMSFDAFFAMFGVLEVCIGIVFLIQGWERVAIFFLFLHMITTLLPLVVIPNATWQAFLIPTIEGQYIIKNLVIIALALGIAAHLEPIRKSK